MNKFLVLVVLAYARSEKLDLTYLPPPGSQYAGGSPGDIQVPLEFPKETYTTTLRPQDFESGVTSPEDYRATIGINRGQQTETTDGDVISGTQAPFSYFQNTYKVPTTTVSYAFTQTTTHPPIEGYETTIGPQFLETGYPNQDGFNIFQTQPPVSTYQGNELQQTQFAGQPPVVGPNSQYPGYAIQPQGSLTVGDNQLAQSRPGFQQNFNQFREQQPIIPTSGLVTQYTGSTVQPQRTGVSYQKNLQTQNRPGNEPTGNQYEEQNPLFAPTTVAVNPKQNLGIVGQNFEEQQKTNFDQQQQGYRQPISRVHPEVPFGQNELQNQTFDDNRFLNQPSFIPSTTLAPSVPSTTQSLLNSLPRLPNAPQSNLPIEIETDQMENNNFYQQRYPGSQINGGRVTNGNRPNILQPSLSTAPATLIPSSQNGQFSTGTPETFGASSTPNYLDAEYQNGLNFNGQRSERPQADADRNAVILNYENVITPEGFAYSFDTSNGIHADESGITTGGVKAKGSYSYIGDDGKLYEIVYTADENGYQPRGDHLPTPPPIPEAIQEIIEKVKKEKEAGIYHDGSYDEEKYGYKKYQGAMRYGPEGSKKQYMNGAEVSEEYTVETPGRPQMVTRKPIVSSSDLSDPDVSDQEQTQFNNERIEYDSKITTQSPINRVTINGQEDGLSDDEDINQYPGYSSMRPSKQPIRQQYDKSQGSGENDNYKIDSDNRRPGNKVALEQIENRLPSDYRLEEPFENNDSNIRILNKGTTSRPPYKQTPQRNQQDDTFEYANSSKRPVMPGSFKRPVSTNEQENTSGQRRDEYETKRPVGNLPGTRPIDRPTIGKIQDLYKTEESYTASNDGNQPSENGYAGEEDLTKNSESITKTPSRLRPTILEPLTPRDQGTRRRPTNISKTSSTQVKDFTYQLEDDDKYVELQDYENGPSQKYGDRRPVSGRPTKISDTKYEKNEEEDGVNVGSYEKTRVPPTSRPRGRQPTFIQDSRGQVLIKDQKLPTTTDTKFGQKLVRPFVNQQQNILVENLDTQQPSNETGYQYFPPQKKFDQDENKRLPVKNVGPTQIPSMRKPQQGNVFFDKNKIKSKPFMTPNVSRDKTVLSEDEYDQEEENPEIVPEADQKQHNNYNDEYSQYPDSVTISEQFDGEQPLTTSPNGPTAIEKQTNYITGRAQTPRQGIIATTPLPSRKPIFEGTYQQKTNAPQYQTTRPGTLRPTTGYVAGTNAEGLPDVSSTFSPSNVSPDKNIQYGSNLPSTTYRPNYTITGPNEPSSTATPGIGVDGFSKRIRPGYGPAVQDNTRGLSSQPIRNQITDIRYQPDSNVEFGGQQRYRPSTKLAQQEVTAIPTFQYSTQNIIGEDFSGPKQQQKFDPETGYYY